MPVQANFIYKVPKDASYVTLRNQNRMLFANYRIQQNNVQQGCQMRVALENGGVADADIIPKLLEGARETTASEIDTIIASEACPVTAPAPAPAPVPTPIQTGGAMLLSSTFGSFGTSVTYPNNAALAIGSQSFTIEWFQYNQSLSSFPRIFSMGTYPSADIAVSYESGSLLFWINKNPNFVGTEPSKNAWVHVAIVGTSATNIKIYVGGNLLGTIAGSYSFIDTTTTLAIGNETTPSSTAAFSGRITNFRWVVGTAVYTNTFTPPIAPLSAIPGTQLLLLASNATDVVKDSSSANRTPTNTGITFSSTTPF